MVNVPFPKNEKPSNYQGINSKHYENSQSRGFEGQQDLVPPQNLEAEEAVIGGILLDPDAINRIADLVQAEAFYLSAHRKIFRTALMLNSQGKPTDLTSMSAWLADTGELESIGGNNRLVELVEKISSTASIEQVAKLITDKFLRRQLIRSGNEVIKLSFDQSMPMEELLDKAEQKIFSISQEKPSKGLIPTAEILTSTFNEIESRSLGTAMAGIPVNFYDLDAMTQGLQRSDLIIVAGRPAMGKTSIVLNLAKNVAQIHDLPICVFSLEMSKEQLTYRLLSMEVGIESGRLRTGRLNQEEWPLLGQGINTLGQLPIFIDDKPNLGVLEMRSLCRRLIAEQGKDLGLIVIDYLQLMEGSTPDNRVQELSRITRGLKAMARELKVPVIALSQLSRGVESRTNKRPMLSDLRESGSIEQDADLVLMIYRDEYYNPETPDRGITEVIVTKHRNGPIGTVKLLFEPQFTRFRNLAN
ncbi:MULTISPECIES: replicative DNA helicase [Prochlorococcus]|uniref:Replicative DNA helicase n=1 Tax=Prochlorococcus marinus (strain SARG / CCMP1375 / SS120) TaxID=167539 RepID=Q7V9J8_PROMA|nr:MULTISPECIES: replicative DNA helicase [Prochlorococcus]AAQ00879.1 Replicative DNA helicase [Prochlorococcus marinus subsp. marinus str. CCMP1375]KGG10627.1 Replicative DNA helicase [Prochlorococcus marinus str. LG]KGG19907.1 Replicative DNA helicase [Prochlorococcus marinus str. SS2]KGG23873.1 Replicative DNA helicase [Prochlorococcus marinus str. SS35]KGG31867.1 Replicative DNA helicase [Prochlorococcus marinus str. SS51]